MKKIILWIVAVVVLLFIGLNIYSGTTVSKIGIPGNHSNKWHLPDESTSVDQMPLFDWPPPTASASYVLHHFQQEEFSSSIYTLGDVDRILSLVLDETGYFERSYYAVPDGYAVVTRLERILEDGTIVANNRWSIDDERIQNFSFSEYLRNLFYADPGLFRVVVFIVTPHPFNQTDRQVSQNEALRWLIEGFNVLPQVLVNKVFTDDYNVTALVYQFEKREDADPTVVIPSNLPGQRHLQATGILNFLN